MLNKYLNKAQAKDFDTLEIVDISNRNFIYKISNDINIINEFLSKFNGLELVEYRQGMSISKSDTKTNKRTYVIFIKNKETDEGLQIYIPFDRYMLISISTLSITENKKDKITVIKHVTKTYHYNIINSGIDFDYLDGLYNSLEELGK